MSMNRRNFLQLLGVSGAAAIVDPTRVFGSPLPERVVEQADELIAIDLEAERHVDTSGFFPTTVVSGVIVRVPQGMRRRLVIVPTTTDRKIFAQLGSFSAHVEGDHDLPVDVRIEAVRVKGLNLLMPAKVSELPAHVQVGDSPFTSKEHPLEIECESTDGDATLYLALTSRLYEVAERPSTPSGVGGVGWYCGPGCEPGDSA